MRQWRVGSFSMGLLLVLLGVGLLLDRFRGGAAALEVIIDWWPAVLILLGAEVLAVGFLSRNEAVKFKYDFWSILLVIVFFCFALGSYAVSATGIIPGLRGYLTAAEYSVTLPPRDIPLDGITRVVLSCPDGNLELRSSDGDTLRLFGRADIYASGGEEAERLAGLGGASVHRAGSTLYVEFDQIPLGRGPFTARVREVNRRVILPAEIALEASGNASGHGARTEVIIDHLAASWSVQSDGPVQATLAPDLDVLVNAATELPGRLAGNAAWKPAAGDSLETATAGTVELGEGSHPLNLISRYEVAVDIR